MATSTTRAGVGLALLLCTGLTTGLDAQRIIPTNQVLITGYGTVGYGYQTQGENINAFTSSMNPIFLFQFQDRVLFEAEFEFALEGGVTETGLEYAQLDFIATDNLTFVAGKFLLPFGVFGDRLHPTWINKFSTAPPIYGHHVSAFGAEPLLPILSDMGVMVRGVVNAGRFNLGINMYAVQGPSIEGDPTEEVPELEFLASSEDGNTNKMLGGRLDIALPPWAELNVSYFNGDYDDQNVLDFTGWNVAGELRTSGFELRGEYIQTRQEIEQPTGFPTLVRQGFYGQAAYRIDAWEPVFRWTQVFDSKLDGTVTDQGAWQAGFGLDYWFSPSIAFMVGYEVNREDVVEVDNDRLVMHIAFGF
ncbi:MAG: porin [Gemmatimonadetes bacterium]|nr:porin [Gemmatimonadota bacterium]